ncbi:MAG: hypothetical protein ACI9HY_004445 [Planctomycetaceae bacterium]|jgi:hypothetical protein
MHRKTDKAKMAYHQSNRMFERDDCWFFDTRGAKVVGPYKDMLEVTTQLEVYIRMVDSGAFAETDLFPCEFLQVQDVV